MEITSLLLPLGIIPSLIILYIITGGYEGKFKERYIFISFIAGIVLGAIIYLIEGSTLYSMPYFIDIIIIYSFLFSFLEQISKFAILNLKKLGNEGLPLYGGALGLGFSSTFAPFFLGKSFEINIEKIPLIFLPISVILISCSIGIMLGMGIKRKESMKYFSLSFLIGAIIWLTLILSFSFNFIPIISIFIALIIFYYSYKKILPVSMLSRRELRKL